MQTASIEIVVEYRRKSNAEQKIREKTLQYIHTKEKRKEYEGRKSGGIGHWIV